MSMMLIDQTKDSACKTAEADAIRAKTGGSAQIAYDWQNDKGFADAIAAIPTGGGGMPWTTVAESTASSDVSEIVLSGDFGAYDVYKVELDGETSATEWIYPHFNSSDTQIVNYWGTSGGLRVFSGFATIVRAFDLSNVVAYSYAYHRQNNAVYATLGNTFDYLKLTLYYGTSTFKSGFKVKIMGGYL